MNVRRRLSRTLWRGLCTGCATGAILAAAVGAGCSPAATPDAELGAPLATLAPLPRAEGCPPAGPCLEPFAAPVLIRRHGPQTLWLRGWDLGQAGAVHLHDTPLPGATWSARLVKVDIDGPELEGDGEIRVVVDGVASNALPTVVAPRVHSVSPLPAGNTTVLIKGDGFGEVAGEVWLTDPGNLVGKVLSWTPTTIQVSFIDFSPDQVTRIVIYRRITHQGRDLGPMAGPAFAWGQP